MVGSRVLCTLGLKDKYKTCIKLLTHSCLLGLKIRPDYFNDISDIHMRLLESVCHSNHKTTLKPFTFYNFLLMLKLFLKVP